MTGDSPAAPAAQARVLCPTFPLTLIAPTRKHAVIKPRTARLCSAQGQTPLHDL